MTAVEALSRRAVLASTPAELEQLAVEAVAAGVPGEAFAAAVDQQLMATRNVQRYATVVNRDTGEPVLWGLVPAPDEERMLLGLPPLAEVEDALWAERDAQVVGDELPAHLDLARATPYPAREPGVVREGDRLTFTWAGVAERPIVLVAWSAGFHLRESAPGLWSVTVRVRDLDRAAFSWTVVPDPQRVAEALAGAQVWRGPAAPPAPPLAETVRGTVRQVHDLGRAVSVYTPPDASGPLPLLLTTDGWLRPELLESVGVPPVVVVAVASEQDAERRREEYLGRDIEAHTRHVELLRALCERAAVEWGATDDRTQRAVFGMSNGAAFALAAPKDLFGQVIAFSVGGPPTVPADAAGTVFHLCSGSWERDFDATTQQVADRLTATGATVRRERLVGGHDVAIWEPALARALKDAFG
jgi:hypothetical protein